jgi:AbrB family looped-hinge helix DNA binding protein
VGVTEERLPCASILLSFYDKAIEMSHTTLSPKFQIVIPKEVRTTLKLRPGTKFHVVEHEGRIELFPFRSVKEMRGFLRGIDPTVSRDKDRT